MTAVTDTREAATTPALPPLRSSVTSSRIAFGALLLRDLVDYYQRNVIGLDQISGVDQ